MSTTPTGATTINHLRPVAWIGQHFQRHRSRPPFQFVTLITAELVFIVFLLSALLGPLLPPVESQEPSTTKLGLVVLIAPFFETWLLQSLPVWLVSRLGGNARWQLLASMTLFAVTHLPNSMINFLTAGIVGGFYFAFSYVHWRQKAGTATAFMLTSTVHLLYNSIIVLLYLFARNVAGG